MPSHEAFKAQVKSLARRLSDGSLGCALRRASGVVRSACSPTRDEQIAALMTLTLFAIGLLVLLARRVIGP